MRATGGETITEEYDLGASAKALGKLYPILKAKNGEIIDGFHRQNADPSWPAIEIQDIDTPQKLELARLASNFCRRTIPKTEIENRIAFLLESGLTPTQIHELTGIGRQTVYDHMPESLKDKEQSEAIKKGLAKKLESTAAYSAGLADLPKCERCGMGSSTLKTWHGHQLCENCTTRADTNPEATDGYFRFKDRVKEGKVPPSIPKPKAIDSWEHRAAAMKPQHSKIELEVRTLIDQEPELRPIIMDRSYPIVMTTPDFVLPEKNVAVYLDGAVHNGREDRDEALREKLTARHGLRVVSIATEGLSAKTVILRIKNAVLDLDSAEYRKNLKEVNVDG